ncbi:Fanconi anemia group C protein isoform X2 [Amia ocellicauda]|uniref:Fanconi anemia group C protein isoform X2 n=1 Tax=Amia ocellicauda TaxID=2972642 RepID=UPI003463C5F8
MAQMSPTTEELVKFWLDKAVEWGQATTLTSQQDVCLHLQKLKAFLQHICQKLQHMSTTVAMRMFPLVGQLFGRLCWNPYVIADEESQRSLLQCLWCLYSTEPQNTVELKANNWIRNLLRHLISEEESSTVSTFLQSVVYISEDEYHSSLVKDMVLSLVTELRGKYRDGIHISGRSPSDRLRSLSVLCVPLVTHPEAAPLIHALLMSPEFGQKGTLSTEFLEAVSNALLKKKLILPEQGVMGLWLCSLQSLEDATLHLIDSSLSDQHLTSLDMEHLIMDSLLPKASAFHPSIFLIVNDIFRTLLLESNGDFVLLRLIKMFTCCFLQSFLLVEAKEKLPLKAFFPHNPQSLVMALLMLPSDVPPQAWQQHTEWISHSLKRAVEGQESAGSGQDLFESWFLLVRCGDWVDIAAQHLTASQSEPSEALLWLLAFYHHPNNESQQRTDSLVAARDVCDQLKVLFSSTSPSLLHLEKFFGRAAAGSQHRHTAPLIQQLFVNFVLFSDGGHTVAKEAVQAMMQESSTNGLSALLAGVEYRLNRYGLMDVKALSRLRTMQESLQKQ